MEANKFRYNEYKYSFNASKFHIVKNALDAVAHGTDPFPVGTVESCYFDTISMKFLNQCFEGTEKKIKFRARRYNNNEFGSLQIKYKNVYGVRKLKGSLPVWKDHQTWRDACSFLDGGDSREIVNISQTHQQLYPTVHIQYRRHRYRFQGCRITLDDQIEAHTAAGLRFANKGSIKFPRCVLEVKTEGKQLFLPPLLKGFVLYGSFSKYALSCSSLLGKTA